MEVGYTCHKCGGSFPAHMSHLCVDPVLLKRIEDLEEQVRVIKKLMKIETTTTSG